MFYTIYKITNKVNNKFYIGKHQTLELNDNYMGSGKLLKRAINKYGITNFQKEILHIFDNEEDMNIKEKELVLISEMSYNLCEGGNGGFGYINKNGLANYSNWLGRHHDINSKTKLSLAISGDKHPNFGKTLSEKTKLKISESLRNNKNSSKRILSVKTKQLMSLKQKGESNSQYGTCWITNGKENKKIKKETLDNYLKIGYYQGRICAGV